MHRSSASYIIFVALAALFLFARAATAQLGAPTLLTPADGATGTGTSTTVTWSAVTGATEYELQVSTDPSFSTTFLDETAITATTYTVTGLDPNSVYYWSVGADDGTNYGPWSSVFSFATGAMGAPALLTPADGTTGEPTSVTVTWSAVPTATTYELQVSTDSTFTTPLFLDENAITATTYTVTGLTAGVMYYWSVGANAGTTLGPWSLVYTFTTAAATTLTVTPTTATLAPGATQQFTATPATGVTWSAVSGTINATGLYTAPATVGTDTVTASTSGGGAQAGTQTVTAAVTIVAFAITPNTVTLGPDGTQAFSATPPNNVTWTAATGTIDDTGFYIAPATSGTDTVTATSPAGTATATVTIVSLTVTPSVATVASGGTQQFTATPPDGVTWYADFGSVDANGLYTAPTTGTTDTVTADSALGYATADITISSTTTSAAPWPMYRHDLQHTGLSPYSGPATATQKWAFTTGGKMDYSSPVIGTDGTVYVGSDDSKLYAINADGTQKWAFTIVDQNDCVVSSSPAIGADGTVYVDGSAPYTSGDLYAINADGTEKWEFRTGPTWSSPTIGANGIVYVSSWAGYLYAINADGTQKWAFALGYTGGVGEINSSPAIGTDGTVYIGSDDNNLYAINADGTKKWAFATGSVVVSSPAIGADGTVYVGSGDDKLYAINADGTQKWAFVTGGSVNSSPAIGADGTVYGCSEDGKLYAINADGTQKWASPTGSLVQNNSSPAIGADGTVYVGAQSDYIFAINPDGTQTWEFPTRGYVFSSPAIGADGTVYAGSDDDNLYAIGAAATLTIAPTTPTVAPGATQQFTANETGVTWTAVSGTITAAGLYTAPATAGTDTVTATVGTQTATAAVTVATATTLPAVTLLSPPTGTTNVSPTTGITLAWQAVTAATGYTVQYTANIAGAWTSATVTGASSLTLPTLTASSTYSWRVQAVNATGTGPWASPWTFATAGPPVAPLLTAPADLATDVDFTAVTLTWKASTSATGYTVEYGTDNTFAAPVTLAETTLTVVLPTLTPRTTYYWRVNASNANGTGNWSATWSFTTSPPPGSQPDLLVSLTPNGTWTGSDLYTPGAQAIGQTVAAGGTATYWLAVRNNGAYSDTFSVQITTGTADWSVVAFDNTGTDITTAATGAGWQVTVAPQALGLFTIKVSAQTTNAANTPELTTVMATSTTTTTLTDTIPLTTQANAVTSVSGTGTTIAPPATGAVGDLMILRADGTAFIGQYVYGSAEQQRRIAYTCAGVPSTYVIRLENDGVASGTFTLAGAAALTGWTATYYDSTGADITAAVTGAGQQVTLGVGVTSDYTLRVTPSAAAGSYTSFVADVTVTLAGATAPGDVVEAVTQCLPAAATPIGVSTIGLGTPYVVSPF